MGYKCNSFVIALALVAGSLGCAKEKVRSRSLLVGGAEGVWIMKKASCGNRVIATDKDIQRAMVITDKQVLFEAGNASDVDPTYQVFYDLVDMSLVEKSSTPEKGDRIRILVENKLPRLQGSEDNTGLNALIALERNLKSDNFQFEHDYVMVENEGHTIPLSVGMTVYPDVKDGICEPGEKLSLNYTSDFDGSNENLPRP